MGKMSDALIPIVIAIVAAVPGVLAFIRGLRSDKTDAASKLTQVAMGMLEPLEKKIADLEAEVSLLQRKVTFYRGVLEGSHRLNGQVKSLGHVPVYDPPSIEELDKLK